MVACAAMLASGPGSAVLSGPLPGVPAERRPLPPSLSARFTDIEVIGEGGMGVVYRAVDPHLGRTVALKVLKGGDPELGRRFVTEARAQAKIQHENVCPVFEAGQVDGEPFIVMRFVDGESLSNAAKNASLEQCVKLVRAVAGAVHEAHRQGTIHRDIKPANILVERCEDGSLKPYVLDFGLARQVDDRGETRTGAIVGTPAYMPPEQARGDLRAIDRRSDVYSLGATLYHLIAGRPPFVAEHPWKLLLQAAYDEPPRLRRFRPNVPRDLETIVMKCLEREPGARYGSARALAEDLGRFLDGEPILGRTAPLWRVLFRRAKRHKALLTFGAVVAVAAAIVLVLWIRAGQRAALEARLARSLGEDVKEMELFLRHAYAMPLHDVERERQVIRERLEAVQQRTIDAGPIGEGPGNYALGRGALALGDPARARHSLEKALAAGYRAPELEIALGRALGALFEQAMNDIRRAPNERDRAARIAEAERSLRDPALAHLRAGVRARLEAPAYAEGLIALYEGQPDLALTKAAEVLEQAPWMVEAKKLEGDAWAAKAELHGHDREADLARMTADAERALRAYAEAADAARSDPDIHRAACGLWEKIGWAREASAVSATSAFDEAVSACKRAVTATSVDVRAQVAYALALSARLTVAGEAGGARAETVLLVAEQARDRAPEDAMSHYAVARVLLQRAQQIHGRGEAVSMEPVLAAYKAVLDRDARFTWALIELGHAHLIAAEIDMWAGRDPTDALARAEQSLVEASEQAPSHTLAAQYDVRAAGLRLENGLLRGTSTDAQVKALEDKVSALAARLGASAWIVVYWRAKALVLRARHEVATGMDQKGSTLEAREVVERFAGEKAPDAWLAARVIEAFLVDAEQAISGGNRAALPLAGARAVADRLSPEDRAESPIRELIVRLDLCAWRSGVDEKTISEEAFSAALASLAPMLDSKKADPTGFQLAAEVLERKAAWEARRGLGPTSRSNTWGSGSPAASFAPNPTSNTWGSGSPAASFAPNPTLKAGLTRVEEALSRDPTLAAAHQARGRLRLLAAQRAGSPEDRAAEEEKANAAFEAARRHNPRLPDMGAPTSRASPK